MLKHMENERLKMDFEALKVRQTVMPFSELALHYGIAGKERPI